MVNIIRRFSQPLMVVFTIVIIISFGLFGPGSDNLRGSNDSGLKLYGRSVSHDAIRRQMNKNEVFAMMRSDYITTLDPGSRQGRLSEIGALNAFVLEHEAEALGVSVTQKEIEDQLLNHSPAFQGQDQKFDPQMYERFVQLGLNPKGFSKDQIEQFLASEVKLRKVREIVGRTVAAVPSEVRDQALAKRLVTEASYVAVKKVDFYIKQTATADEIKKSYEEKKELLKTPEERKVRYAAFTLQPAPDGKPLEEKARIEQLGALAEKAYNFRQSLAAAGAKFEELAKQAGATVSETKEFFGADDVPEELEASPKIAEEAFKLTKEKPFSDHIVLEKGTYVLQYGDAKAPAQMALEMASGKLSEEIKQQKADTAMRAKADELLAKIADAKKAGKSFYEAAEAAGVKAEPFPAFGGKNQLKRELDFAQFLPAAAAKLAPGELSGVIPANGDVVIVHVDQRPPVDEKDLGEEIKQVETDINDGQSIRFGSQKFTIKQGRRDVAFAAWLHERAAAAGVPAPKTATIGE